MTLAHSPLGPSSADRWINCPGSVRLTAGLPDTESQYAAEGTVAHHLTEVMRRDGIAASSFLGQTIDEILVKQEMVDAVEMFVEHVEETPGFALIEVRTHFGEWVPEGFGTLDDARLAPGKATITDFKYGKGVQVFAENNSQLKVYALGVLAEWDWLYDFQNFVLCVHQPRLDHIDTWAISRADLLAWAASVVKPKAAEALSGKGKVCAGDWCQWCKIKATCRVRATSVFNSVVGDFESIEDAASRTPAEAATLSNSEIAVALTAIGNIKKWCAAIEAHAMSEIKHGHEVGDYKIVAGRSSRGWGLDAEEIAGIWAAKGLAVEDLYEKKMLTMPAAEKVAGKKNDIWKVEGLVVKSAGKPTLAPGSDPRPALVLDPNAEFEDISTQETE